MNCKIGFIVGTGRCGTTLLAQMLNAHSEICIPPEIQILFQEAGNGERLYEIFKSKKNLLYFRKDYIELVKNRCPHKLELFYDYESFFSGLIYPCFNFRKLINLFYSSIAFSKNKSIFMEQTPWYGQNIELLNKLFNKPRIIHMIRDGRDVAISFKRTPWWHDTIEENIKRWNNEITKIVADSTKYLNDNQYLEIKYEDLVNDTKQILMKICNFLNVNYQDDLIDVQQYENYSKYSKLSDEVVSDEFKKWEKNPKQPVFKESVYAWKRNNDFDFNKLSIEVKKTLKKLNYECY